MSTCIVDETTLFLRKIEVQGIRMLLYGVRVEENFTRINKVLPTWGRSKGSSKRIIFHLEKLSIFFMTTLRIILKKYFFEFSPE